MIFPIALAAYSANGEHVFLARARGDGALMIFLAVNGSC